MSSFSDHFSATASSYAAYRPHYPDALFRWLGSQAANRHRAWDCGAGSGQAAVALASYFDDVVATDPSTAQLAHGERRSGVHYVAMTAERAALANLSVDVITVAQALHWFDRPSFYREVSRVLRPGGLLAVWSYGTIRVNDELDSDIGRFYHETVGPYWPSERSFVDSGYAGIELPFEEQHAPSFEMTAEWTLHQLGGYLSTWSAVNRYRAAHGTDPVPEFMGQIAQRWGSSETVRTVRWPLLVRLSRRPTPAVA